MAADSECRTAASDVTHLEMKTGTTGGGAGGKNTKDVLNQHQPVGGGQEVTAEGLPAVRDMLEYIVSFALAD